MLTCWLSLCGTCSPINRSVSAAYLEAMALGEEATDLSGVLLLLEEALTDKISSMALMF